MTIKIEKFGKIKNADIRIDGLTVIAGCNDTGKSTIGKSLYAIIKSVVNFPDLYDKLTKREVAYNIVPIIFELGRSYNGDKENKKYQSLVKIRNNLMHTLNPETKPEDAFDDVFEAIDILCDFLDENPKLEISQANLNEMKTKLSRDVDSTEKFIKIILSIFGDCFNWVFNNSVHNDISKVTYSVGNNDIASVTFTPDNEIKGEIDVAQKGASFRNAIFIDSPLYLDEKIESESFFIEELKSCINTSKKLFSSKNENLGFLKKLEDLLQGGTFIYNKDLKRFEYKVSSNGKSLGIENIASGAKSLGLLYILLKTGVLTKDTLLILDEPENHLHPKWQISYAKLLVDMVEDGFNILLTSHSPTFIHAIAKFASIMVKKTDKINFYLANSIKDENYSEIRNVNDNINDIFDNLTSPEDILYFNETNI